MSKDKLAPNEFELFLRRERVVERHKNGTISYEATFGIVNPKYQDFFGNKIIHADGTMKVRILSATKYWPNGIINWQHDYGELGNLIKCHTSRRADGSLIEAEKNYNIKTQ